MTGTTPPDNLLDEGEDNTSSPAESDRRPPSILALAFVSGLNVICLAFIAFHFASHSDEERTTSASAAIADTQEMPSLPSMQTETTDAVGNIDFAPTSKRLTSIASYVDMIDDEPIIDQENDPIPATGVAGRGGPVAALGSWVQVGALSEEETAKHYWSDLKKRYVSLLEGQDPRFFGPDDVGGSYFHIRLGPMTEDAAEELCDRLETKGVDCFCVRPAEG